MKIFLKLLKISGGEDSPTIQSDLPNTENIDQPEGVGVDMLDYAQYILLLLNTISQAAGSIPDDVRITGRFLDKMIRSHNKSAFIGDVPKLVPQNPPLNILVDPCPQIELTPHTSN